MQKTLVAAGDVTFAALSGVHYGVEAIVAVVLTNTLHSPLYAALIAARNGPALSIRWE